MQIEKLRKYCDTMLLKYELIDPCYLYIDNSTYRIVLDGERALIDEDGCFIEGKDSGDDADGFVFEFGGRWYIQDAGQEEIQLKELKYIGRAVGKLETKAFLGIRSGYELMNGMGLYPDWIKKAKFLGIDNLAICEKNTLAGVLEFQNECKKNNIKSIIGMTVTIEEGDNNYDAKIYAKNFQGWLALLKFNKVINVDKASGVTLDLIHDYSKDIYFIADPKVMSYSARNNLFDFYQLDTVRFLNQEKDSDYLDNLESFIKSDIEPICITDAFYLEQEDWMIRESLWKINKAFDDKTNNQFFKSKSQYASELIQMFGSENTSWINLYKKAISSEELLVKNCNFQYDTDTRHLPKYVMTNEEREQYSTNDALFLDLIKKGFEQKNIECADKYLARLKKEIQVLKASDTIDYFLSLYDIIKYAKSQNMLTGIGRGSAGGSLVAYLLGIIQVDPLRFDLLFERFLNSGRMGRFEERPSFKITQEDGSIVEFQEGSLVRILRRDREMVVFVHELIEGDNIIKF